MTKPFALDPDGKVRVVAPPKLRCFLAVDESTDDRTGTATHEAAQTDER